MKNPVRKVFSTLFLFSVIILTGFVFACSSNKPVMDWMPQYPNSYQKMYRAELVYSDSDWMNSKGPVDFSINDIYVNDSNEVWAIKDYLQILYSRDGQNFHKIATPHVHQLNCIKGANKEVWAVGCEGSIIHIKNEKCIKEGVGLTKKDIWALWINAGGTDCWAVGNEGVILHYKGGKWVVVQEGITKKFIHDVCIRPDGTEGWAVGNEGVMLHYTGGKWVVVDYDTGRSALSKPKDLMKVWMNESCTEGWALGDDGMILHYKSGVWNREGNYGYDCNMHNLCMKQDCSEGWALGNSSIISHYKDGKWVTEATADGSAYNKSMYSDGETCWIVGSKFIYHAIDFHKLAEFPKPDDFYSDCVSGNKNGIWIGGSDDKIMKLGASPGAVYPTLANTRYRLIPANKPDSIAVDFQLVAENGNINQYLPINFALKVKQKDGANFQYIQCAFVRKDTAQNSGIWTAKFSLGQFNTDIDKKINNQLKMKLTFHTVNANEDVVYDLKEGSNDYLTLK